MNNSAPASENSLKKKCVKQDDEICKSFQALNLKNKNARKEFLRTCFNFGKYTDGKVAHIPEEKEGKFTINLF